MSLFGSKQPKELLPSSTVNSEFETFLNVSTITDLVPGCSAPTDIISSSHIDLVANTHTQVSRMSSITHVSPNSSCSVHTETDVVIKQEFDNIDVNTTDKSSLHQPLTVNHLILTWSLVLRDVNLHVRQCGYCTRSVTSGNLTSTLQCITFNFRKVCGANKLLVLLIQELVPGYLCSVSRYRML